MTRHPMLVGFALGAGAVWLYEHFRSTPKMPVGKHKPQGK